MSRRTPIKSASIYFFAGDFADVVRRHAEGAPQVYGTHDEVARLIEDLLERSIELTVHSFCSPLKKVEQPLPGLTVKSLGAKRYDDDRMLVEAVAEDRSEALIPHFPNISLLNAVTATAKRSAAFMATSFFRQGPRSWLRRRRTIAALNRGKFELISNHCLPSTEHLADLGVARSRLIPWDVPHLFSPQDTSPKFEPPQSALKVFYAGSISEEKGVGDVVRAIPRIAADVRFTFAGNGELEAMRALAKLLGVEARANFIGSIPNPDVFKRFQEADVLIVPSRREFQEGFPLTLFEAVASHTPIVCSDHPIFKWAMTDGVNAILFRAGDTVDLARAVDRLASDPDLYLRLSRAAEQTWESLRGPADWRRLIVEWVTEGPDSPWIQRHMLDRLCPIQD
jgi:glycosyltransferase involved in cell wall biosynthesis